MSAARSSPCCALLLAACSGVEPVDGAPDTGRLDPDAGEPPVDAGELDANTPTLDGTWACQTLRTWELFQDDATAGCSPPSPDARRVRTSGNAVTPRPRSMD